MKTSLRVFIVFLVAAAAAVALSLKPDRAGTTPSPEVAIDITGPLPRLVDLGAGKCIPCKAMKPILDDLMANHPHQFTTFFIDVWEHPDQGKAYGVQIIPTQIFYDAQGQELWRNEGFLSKEDIFKAWKRLGYDFPIEAGDA